MTTEGFTAAMSAQINEQTRIVFISHISSPTALRLPIEPIVNEARRRGVLTLIDGAHAPGQIDRNLEALGADFYTGNGHKWLCAPKGTAFLHALPRHHALLHAAVASWGYVAEGLDEGGSESSPTPWDDFIGRSLLERRLQWQGSRDITGFLAVPAALRFQAEHDWRAQRTRRHTMAMAFMDRVVLRTGLAPMAGTDFFEQMATLPVPAQDPSALQQRLYDEYRIEVPVTQHQGRTFVRLSAQANNKHKDLDRLEEALELMGLFRH